MSRVHESALLNKTCLCEQSLVDCSNACSQEGSQQVCNDGCSGGRPWSALTDVKSWGGINSEIAYPYTGSVNNCERYIHLTYAPVTNYTCLSGPNNADETAMMAFSYLNGPLRRVL